MKDKEDQTPLHYAVMQGHLAVLRSLLKKPGVSSLVNVPDKEGRTLLHFAALNASVDILAEMIASAAVSVQDKCGFTPLHYAVAAKQDKNIALLLDKKVEIKSAYREKIGEVGLSGQLTPLWLALEIEAYSLFSLLVQFSKDLSIRDSNGNTVGHIAARYGNSNNLKKWDQQFGANFLTLENKKGELPLHLAAERGCGETVKWISERMNEERQRWINRVTFSSSGFSLDKMNHEGKTAYNLAQEHGHSETMSVLKAKGANKRKAFLLFIKKTIYRQTSKTLSVAALEEKNNKREHLIAERIKEFTLLISQQDVLGRTVLHDVVDAVNPRMANIVLHPLLKEARQSVCRLVNAEGDTALALLRKKKARGSFAKLEQLERILLLYDTAPLPWSFYWQSMQDRQSVLRESLSYRSLSTLLIAHPHLSAFIRGLYHSGHLCVGLEEAASSFFEGDTLDRGERLLGLITSQLPTGQISRVLGGGVELLRYVGFYRHTLNRVFTWGLNKVSLAGLQYLSLHPYFIRNYFTYLEIMSILFLLSEEANRFAAAYATERIAFLNSIEACLVKLGMPSLNTLAESGLAQVTQGIEWLYAPQNPTFHMQN